MEHSFQHFVLTLPRGEADFTKLDHTDGIVVTTGGQQRLVEGLNLLVSGTTDKLLIVGVAKGVNKAVLVQELNLSDQQVSALFCCVELEYGALDTRGNALAARAWNAAAMEDVEELGNGGDGQRWRGGVPHEQPVVDLRAGQADARTL